VFTALDADEANELTSAFGSKGDLVSYGSSTFETLGVGTNDEVLIADSGEASGLKWGAVDTAQLADDAVTTAKIDDGAVDTAQLADDAVTSPKISLAYADASARTTALPSPAEGDLSYLSDTDSVEVYDGSAWAAVAGGKILQIVSTTETGTFSASVTTGTYSTAAISTTITPSSTASKVLILAQVSARPSATYVANAALFRGGSLLTGAAGDAAGSRRRGTSGAGAGDTADRLAPTIPIVYLDSPNTTSATTYDVRLGHNNNGTDTVYLNRTSGDANFSSIARLISSLTLIEVSA